MRCPSCDQALVDREVGEAAVRACTECAGVLVKTSKLVPLLEAMAGPMMKAIDIDAPIEKVEPREGDTACPSCGKTMERFGYMGSPLVPLARCGDEWLVWAEADALGTAALLYARTNRRVLARKVKDDALREQMASSTRARAKGRSYTRRVTTALIIGGAPGAAVYMAGEALVKKS